MNFQALLNSRYSVGLALGMGRWLPASAGHGLARWAGGVIAGMRETGIVRAVEANQWVAGGEALSRPESDRRVRAVFQNTGRCLFDFYHCLGRPEAVQRIFTYTDGFERFRERACDGIQGARGARGSLIVTAHLSNFDLAGQAMVLRGIKMLVLSHPQPKGGYRMQNQMRGLGGLETLPMSIESLRRAEEILKAGGAVTTGIDRPVPETKYQPVFFGRPAPLPVMHIRLALKLDLPVTVVACQTLPGGAYRIQASDPIPMRREEDQKTEILRNAEAVLRVIEEWIKPAPEQWSMFYPVWPEGISELRGKQ